MSKPEQKFSCAARKLFNFLSNQWLTYIKVLVTRSVLLSVNKWEKIIKLRLKAGGKKKTEIPVCEGLEMDIGLYGGW